MKVHRIFGVFQMLLIFCFDSHAQLSLQSTTHLPDVDILHINAFELDVNENKYIAGHFFGLADLDPGPGNTNYTPQGFRDLYVAKYSANGDLTWSFTIGGPRWEEVFDLALDPDGNVYVAGVFADSVDFDPGAGEHFLVSQDPLFTDLFIAKYDFNGAFVWAHGFGSIGADQALSITLDGNRNVYVAGYFEDTVDFNPGTGKAILTAQGAEDGFFAKYDPNGNLLFAKALNGVESIMAEEIQLDHNGNILVSGKYKGTADMNPSTLVAPLISAGDWDGFVAKYAPDGSYQWAFSIGSQEGELAPNLETDNQNNLYATGVFDLEVDFDPSANQAIQTAKGNFDAYIAKYDSAGNYIWSQQIGAAGGGTYGRGLTFRFPDQLYFEGTLIGSTFFGPAQTGVPLTAYGQSDLILAKYNTAGDWIWAAQLGGNEYVNGTLAIGSSGDLFATGLFSGQVDFDFSTDSNILDADNSTDVFFARYAQSSFTSNQTIPLTSHIKVFPNPTSGLIRFAGLEPNSTIEIINGLGQRVHLQQVQAGGIQTLQLNAPSGVYFAKVFSADQVNSMKLIIQH